MNWTVAMRSKQPVVDWWRMVWHSSAIPRHAFICCLDLRNRLTTHDRLLNWGYQGNILHVF